MPGAVCRVGDRNSAGGVIVSGVSSVLVNNRAVAVVGKSVSPHPCCGQKGCPPVHCSARTSTNNSGVFVEGKPVITQGDKDTCSHARANGSNNVIVG